MTGAPPPLGANVFINYRRSGDASRHVAGRIFDRLCHDLGKDRVFIDVDRIPLGRDFVESLEEQIDMCGYVLALIGPGWLDVRNERGKRRLDDPKDWVRIELATALRRGIPVIPVLIDGGNLPAERDLPSELRSLPRRQALTLTDAGFHHELDRLVDQIKRGLERTGKLESKRASPPPRPKAVEPSIVVSPKSGIALVRIEGGTFVMGAAAAEKDAEDDEHPQHQVTLSTFLLGRHPVTNAQYAQYLAANPQVAKPHYWGHAEHRHPNQPVVGINWSEAVRYAEWAELRLPTESEWEYACRAGSQGCFAIGETKEHLGKLGWYDENSGNHPPQVATLAPNPWGLHDMHGNVWEWCADRYAKYAPGPQVDPLGPAAGRPRVVRGGSWTSPARSCRSAARSWNEPGTRSANLGFRLAAAISSGPFVSR